MTTGEPHDDGSSTESEYYFDPADENVISELGDKHEFGHQELHNYEKNDFIVADKGYKESQKFIRDAEAIAYPQGSEWSHGAATGTKSKELAMPSTSTPKEEPLTDDTIQSYTSPIMKKERPLHSTKCQESNKINIIPIANSNHAPKPPISSDTIVSTASKDRRNSGNNLSEDHTTNLLHHKHSDNLNRKDCSRLPINRKTMDEDVAHQHVTKYSKESAYSDKHSSRSSKPTTELNITSERSTAQEDRLNRHYDQGRKRSKSRSTNRSSSSRYLSYRSGRNASNSRNEVDSEVFTSRHSRSPQRDFKVNSQGRSRSRDRSRSSRSQSLGKTESHLRGRYHDTRMDRYEPRRNQDRDEKNLYENSTRKDETFDERKTQVRSNPRFQPRLPKRPDLQKHHYSERNGEETHGSFRNSRIRSRDENYPEKGSSFKKSRKGQAHYNDFERRVYKLKIQEADMDQKQGTGSVEKVTLHHRRKKIAEERAKLIAEDMEHFENAYASLTVAPFDLKRYQSNRDFCWRVVQLKRRQEFLESRRERSISKEVETNEWRELDEYRRKLMRENPVMFHKVMNTNCVGS